jgi:hypothetical protein
VSITTAKGIVLLRRPQTPDDTRLLDFIALAELQTAESAFGDKYIVAVALRVLHWLTMEEVHGGDLDGSTSSGTAVAGAIKAEREGDLQRQYGGSLVLAQRYPDLSSTQYGNELLELMKACIIKARTSAVGRADVSGLVT